MLDLSGVQADFNNIITRDKEVYCSACGALIGSVSANDNITIRTPTLIRVDPLSLVSVCIGDINNNTELSPHQHLSHMLMIDNRIVSPILPIGLISIRDGRVLPEPCPYALNVLPQDVMTPRSFSNSTQRVIELSTEVVSDNIDSNTNINVLDERPSRQRTMKLLRSVVKKRLNKKLRAQKIRAKNVRLSIAASERTVATEPPTTECQMSTNEDVATSATEPQEISQVLDVEPFSTVDHGIDAYLQTPMDRSEFDRYLQNQPSTSSNIYEPSVNQMIMQQQLYGLTPNLGVTEHSYVSIFILYSNFYSISCIFC